MDTGAVRRRHSPPGGVRSQGAVVPPLQVGAAQVAELRAELQAALRDRDDARVALQVRAPHSLRVRVLCVSESACMYQCWAPL